MTLLFVIQGEVEVIQANLQHESGMLMIIRKRKKKQEPFDTKNGNVFKNITKVFLKKQSINLMINTKLSLCYVLTSWMFIPALIRHGTRKRQPFTRPKRIC